MYILSAYQQIEGALHDRIQLRLNMLVFIIFKYLGLPQNIRHHLSCLGHILHMLPHNLAPISLNMERYDRKKNWREPVKTCIDAADEVLHAKTIEQYKAAKNRVAQSLSGMAHRIERHSAQFANRANSAMVGA